MSTSPNADRCGLFAIAAIGSLIAIACTSGPAAAWTLLTRHTFCTSANCPDGKGPQAALVMLNARHFFGTASGGGGNASGPDGGVVYELVHNPDSSWSYKVIYSFCTLSNCADGSQPLADLIVDKDGNLYGTTWAGGAYSQGTVFELSHGASGWTENVIRSFSGGFNGSTDGRNPAAGLSYAGQSTGAPWDEFSPLFGTTYTGGTYGKGVVFELTSDGSLWNYTQIHDFRTSKFPTGTAMDSAGNIFGSTFEGGPNNGGVFYKLAHGTWKETVLHQFCSQPNCADGWGMYSRPVLDANGNIFGTTLSGGAAGGVIFELTHGSSGYSYSVIHNLCSSSGCAGGESGTGLTFDSAGDLLGSTEAGGVNNGGTIFRLHKGVHGWKENVIYSFCSLAACRDGAGPKAPVILDSVGDLFGTTYAAGDATTKAGTVFELRP